MKRAVVSSAAEAAEMLLRCDNIIRARPRAVSILVNFLKKMTDFLPSVIDIDKWLFTRAGVWIFL